VTLSSYCFARTDNVPAVNLIVSPHAIPDLRTATSDGRRSVDSARLALGLVSGERFVQWLVACGRARSGQGPDPRSAGWSLARSEAVNCMLGAPIKSGPWQTTECCIVTYMRGHGTGYCKVPLDCGRPQPRQYRTRHEPPMRSPRFISCPHQDCQECSVQIQRIFATNLFSGLT